MRPIRTAVLSLGSNLGDRFAALQGAIGALADTPDVRLVAVSSVYETTPVDAPDGSPDFLNAVVLADTTLSVAALLDRLHAIETTYGREREETNAPRPSTSTSSSSATGCPTPTSCACPTRARMSGRSCWCPGTRLTRVRGFPAAEQSPT